MGLKIQSIISYYIKKAYLTYILFEMYIHVYILQKLLIQYSILNTSPPPPPVFKSSNPFAPPLTVKSCATPNFKSWIRPWIRWSLLSSCVASAGTATAYERLRSRNSPPIQCSFRNPPLCIYIQGGGVYWAHFLSYVISYFFFRIMKTLVICMISPLFDRRHRSWVSETPDKYERALTHWGHWGRVTYICVAYLTIIGSDNGLSPGRCQAIIWTNAGILLISPFGTNFSEILIKIHTFSFKKMHLKMSSAKRWPFCLGLNVLKHI